MAATAWAGSRWSLLVNKGWAVFLIGVFFGLALANAAPRYSWLVLQDGYPVARADRWSGEVAFCNALSGCLSPEERSRRVRDAAHNN